MNWSHEQTRNELKKVHTRDVVGSRVSKSSRKELMRVDNEDAAGGVRADSHQL